MADENLEELPSAENIQSSGKAPNPWIPLIATLVLMPAITAAVAIFVVIPKMPGYKSAAADERRADAAEAHAKPRSELKVEKVEFDRIVANIGGAGGTRYVRSSFTVEGTDAEFKQIVENNAARVEDAALSVLQSLTMTDIDQPGLKNIVRSDMIRGINTALPKPIVEDLFFSEFVIQ